MIETVYTDAKAIIVMLILIGLAKWLLTFAVKLEDRDYEREHNLTKKE